MITGPHTLPDARPVIAQQALRTVLERLEAYLTIRPGQDASAALADLIDAWEAWRHLNDNKYT